MATGERLCTKYEFARVLETGAASILQPALGRVGGILECKKIAGMAETHYAQVAPCTCIAARIEAAANIQFAACIPNFLILESIQQLGGFHEKLLKKKIQWEDGYVIPSKDPGLGGAERRSGAGPSVHRQGAADQRWRASAGFH